MKNFPNAVCTHIHRSSNTYQPLTHAGEKKDVCLKYKLYNKKQHITSSSLTWPCRAKINIDTFRAQWQNQTKHIQIIGRLSLRVCEVEMNV